MRSRLACSVLAVLFVAAYLPATVQAANSGLPGITPPQAAPFPTRPGAGFPATEFTLLGSVLSDRVGALADTATLSGHVINIPYGSSGTVDWWLDGVAGGGQTEAAADGGYSFTEVPPAAGNGTIVTSLSKTFTTPAAMLGYTSASWAAGAETVFDCTVVGGGLSMVSGGPWTDWTNGSVWAYGSNGTADLLSETDITPTKTNTIYTMPGLYDAAAVYWFLNQGLELHQRLRFFLTRPAPIVDCEFANESAGWMATHEGLGVDSTPLVLRTTDGGLTWTRHQAAEAGVTLRQISFPDAAHGWAVGSRRVEPTPYTVARYGYIATTQDGGLTWTEQTSPVTNELNAVEFADSTHGVAVGTAGTIIVTSDGGTTWTEVPSPVAIDLLDLTFNDGFHGWAGARGGVLLLTDDGGASWTAIDSGLAQNINRVDTADGIHVVAVTPGGRTSYSADGGLTWTPSSESDDSPQAVTMLDGLTGWMVGYRAGIYKTVDGGATWTVQQDPVSTDNGYLDVACADATHVWAVGGRYNAKVTDTADGGALWSTNVLTADQGQAQRITVASRFGASGSPGSTLKLRPLQLPEGLGIATPRLPGLLLQRAHEDVHQLLLEGSLEGDGGPDRPAHGQARLHLLVRARAHGRTALPRGPVPGVAPQGERHVDRPGCIDQTERRDPDSRAQGCDAGHHETLLAL